MRAVHPGIKQHQLKSRLIPSCWLDLKVKTLFGKLLTGGFCCYYRTAYPEIAAMQTPVPSFKTINLILELVESCSQI